MTKKCIFSEKNSLDLFSLFLFLTRIFFTWFWIENIFFLMKIQFRRLSIFMTRQRKKIHSALLLLSSTQMYLIFLRIFSTLFLRENFFFSMKNKNSLGSAHRISFSGCVFKENIFLHFSLRNSEKVRKKYSHWLFFFTQFHILFFLLLIFSEKI